MTFADKQSTVVSPSAQVMADINAVNRATRRSHRDLVVLADPAVVSLPFPLAQLRFLDLAGGGLGQFLAISTAAGRMKPERWSLANARMSSGEACWPALSSTNALGRSPHFSSGVETTAAAATAGCRATAVSTSMVEMFSPPETMMSFLRSRSSM